MEVIYVVVVFAFKTQYFGIISYPTVSALLVFIIVFAGYHNGSFFVTIDENCYEHHDWHRPRFLLSSGKGLAEQPQPID